MAGLRGGSLTEWVIGEWGSLIEWGHWLNRSFKNGAEGERLIQKWNIGEWLIQKWDISEWGSSLNELLVEWGSLVNGGPWLNGSIDWMWTVVNESFVHWVLSFQIFCTLCGQLVKIATHKEWTWSSRAKSILVFCKVLRFYYSLHVNVFVFYTYYKIVLNIEFCCNTELSYYRQGVWRR